MFGRLGMGGSGGGGLRQRLRGGAGGFGRGGQAVPFDPATAPEQELGALTAEVESCRETIAELTKRIAELESGKS